MSNYEHIKGKLRLINYLNCNLEETCKMVLCEYDIKPNAGSEPDDHYDSYEIQLTDEMYEEYVVWKGNLYQVTESENIEEYDVYIASRNNDGSINYEICYYNGGQSFNEAIETAMDNIDK